MIINQQWNGICEKNEIKIGFVTEAFQIQKQNGNKKKVSTVYFISSLKWIRSVYLKYTGPLYDLCQPPQTFNE